MKYWSTWKIQSKGDEPSNKGKTILGGLMVRGGGGGVLVHEPELGGFWSVGVNCWEIRSN